tara:strand:+ start:229 stop:966 length:738 start_codon:yes stop_codon:yes gene_type:complete
MPNNFKTFSIITPVLNNKEGLIRTIESIKKQNFRNYEIIVIDGGSNDGTKQYLENEKAITKKISESDKGIYDAINKGINISNAEYINTINAGDEYFSENSLQIIKNYFDHNADISFVFGAVKKGKVYYKYEPKKMNWSFNFYPAHSGGFFIKKKVHDEIGLYNLKYKCSSDYDFFWRLIKKHNYKGISTKKNELVSIFEPGGYSSKLSFFEHVVEETLIRINNKQSKLLVLLIFFIRCLKNYRKI